VKSEPANPRISFFVACYNEEENIEATLDCLISACRQRATPYEIIVIDDGSRRRFFSR